MTANALELALKKQRLQIASELLRRDFGRDAQRLRPVFVGADFAIEGARWMRRNPQLIVAAGVAFLVARPKRVWRWARRGFSAWLAWRNLSRLLDRAASI